MSKHTVGKFIRGQCQILNPSKAKDLFFTYEECRKTCSTGMSFNSYRKRCSEIFRGYVQANTPSEKTQDVSMGVVSSEIQKDTIKQTVVLSTRFTTAEELAKYCDIDLSVWEAEKIVTNQWGKSPEPNWQFKIIWKRISGLSPQMVLDTIKKHASEYTYNKLKKHEVNIGDVALEIQIPDAHLGRYVSIHSDKPYNMQLAHDVYLDAN